MAENFRFSDAFKAEAEAVRAGFRTRCVSDIFFPVPAQMGLRGDAYLWMALAARLRRDPDSIRDFDSEFRHAFEDLTAHDFDHAPDEFRVEAFSHGGMSSGGIAMDWWRVTAKPLLEQRWASLNQQECS